MTPDPPDERRPHLADSPEPSPASATDQRWAEEAERHHAMLQRGDPGIPADEVLEELSATLP